MDKNDITEKIKKIFKDNKNLSNLVAIILVLIFILIAVNIFKPRLTSVTAGLNSSNTSNNNEISPKEVSYEEEQKKQLIEILKKIDGCGNVDCMLTFSSGEVKVPAYDETKQNNVTEENDKDGGKRTTTQNNDNSKVVMSNKNGDSEPFILETQKPKVTGVVVVAEGAKEGKVKSDIEKAVTNLYDLPANKVNVYSMK
ncbi:MAG: stage III sporulation protein AG [Clostridium sp.]|uniref:stage III sporulation protein AG n=1 Tax=Clostridium sp. DSM 8431 TaxID=1761781 RepID=UPI0008E8A908|nr:stage III sporulation protein AG [Clostridium sp. DSM 8431]MCR4944049.1 stage III sporulation protein AG [Clostridium sp.]SFU55947.1 stage III sporulation protein AG [Clostridium sp. DSM 8431]